MKRMYLESSKVTIERKLQICAVKDNLEDAAVADTKADDEPLLLRELCLRFQMTKRWPK